MPEFRDHQAEQDRLHKLSERSLAARSHAVWLGFGLLLFLIALGSAYSYVSVANLAETVSKTRAESHERDQLLDQLANSVYRASTVARDHLLALDRDRVASLRMELEAMRADMFETLASYESKAAPSEAQSLAAFHSDIDSFWKIVEPPLHWSPQERVRNSDAYLAGVLLPKEQEVETLAREIALRDDREIEELDRLLQSHYLDIQRDQVIASTVVLLSGLAAALLSTRRIRRLEREAELRYEQVEQARMHLRDLSNQVLNAQEEERRKLSRELHDQLGQSTSALVTELGRMEHDPTASEDIRARAAAARQIAEDTVRSIRDTALLLRPSMLDDLGLVPALRWQAREVRRRSPLKVRVTADETSDDLPDAYKTCIFRVVQEALHNCVKHAKATEARVVVEQTPKGLSVSIQDDGVGFDAAGEKGMGLLGMEERVARLGGVFRVESAPGQGTTLSVLFPDVAPTANTAVTETEKV
jgi:signal transduction histidine kinase